MKMQETPTEKTFREKHGNEVVMLSHAIVGATQLFTDSATIGLNGLLNALLIVICDQAEDVEAALQVKKAIIMEKVSDEAFRAFHAGHKEAKALGEKMSATVQ